MILLGLPGAGKGTQAARVKDRLGLAHITTGELFRENIRRGTPLGKEAQPYYDAGQLVPNELTIGMLLDRLKEPDAQRGTLFDGYPRNVEQAQALDAALASSGKQIDKAVYISVPTEELVRRLAGRWSCAQCGAVYHEQSAPPKTAGACDNCGAQLTQRSDDRPDVVRTRLQVNEENLEPLLAYYRGQGKLAEVNGEQDADNVTRELEQVLA